MLGIKWLYVSNVILIELWPSLSWTTLDAHQRWAGGLHEYGGGRGSGSRAVHDAPEAPL